MSSGRQEESAGGPKYANDDANDSSRLKDYFDHQPYQDDELFADEQVSSN